MTTLTAGVQAAIIAEIYRPARFVTITFPGLLFRVWTGIGTFTIDGNDYTGAGSLGNIAAITDTATDGVNTFNAQRLALTLSGLDPSLAAGLRLANHQGSPVEIIEALLDSNGAVIDDDYAIFNGEVDTMSMTLGDTLTINVQCENYISFLFRGPDGRRRTTADQEDLFPGDKGLEFDGNLPVDIPWGVAGGASVPAASGFNGRLGGRRTGGLQE